MLTSALVLHPPEALTSPRHLSSWALLAFGAGATNAGALLACQRFVAHVTGTVTRIGVDAGQILALDYALVLGAFVAGAMIAILLARWAGKHDAPCYWAPLGLVASVLVLVGLAGRMGAFGAFGGTVETAHDFALLAVLGFAMGMQNAAVAASTSMAVRTTHMTGPATDVAIGLAVLLSGRPEERKGARQSIVLRGTKLVAFIVGGAAMAVLCPRIEYLAFLLPAATCTVATLATYVPRRSPEPKPA